MNDKRDFIGFEAMQQTFGTLAPVRNAVSNNWADFWRTQEKVLNSMQDFAGRWFDRRREATSAAIETSRRFHAAESPMDFAREWQAFVTGSMQRAAEDGLACQKHVMALVELAGSQAEGAAQQTTEAVNRTASEVRKRTEQRAEAA